jgi:hypothetical protein
VICRPFVGPLYCTIKNARRVTLIIYTVSILYAVPLMFEYEPHADSSLSKILLVNHNKNIYRYRLTELGSNSIFRWTYVLINALGVYVIPLTTIIILNRKLFTSIRSLQRRSIEYNAPLPTKQGKLKGISTHLKRMFFRKEKVRESLQQPKSVLADSDVLIISLLEIVFLSIFGEC